MNLHKNTILQYETPAKKKKKKTENRGPRKTSHGIKPKTKAICDPYCSSWCLSFDYTFVESPEYVDYECNFDEYTLCTQKPFLTSGNINFNTDCRYSPVDRIICIFYDNNIFRLYLSHQL